MSQNESLTTEEVAHLLKVSKLTVYDLIKKGEILSYRVGRQIRVDAKELDNYKSRGKEVESINKTKQNQDKLTSTRPIIISGQDSSLDILARKLEGKSNRYRPLRSYVGSLDSLIAMYQGKADIVSTHLLDGDTLEYNVPYVRKLLVSKPFLIVNFVARQAGLYVAKGNPKNIQSWGDLQKPTVTIINRESGSGARVLLDEQLRIHQIDKSKIKGYVHELTSHMAIASMIASKKADVGIGIEHTAKMISIDFIPMITESYDLVMLKTNENAELISFVLEILRSTHFQDELLSLGYDIKKTGKVLYNQ